MAVAAKQPCGVAVGVGRNAAAGESWQLKSAEAGEGDREGRQ